MDNKAAQTDYPIHDLLRTRWSPRSFDSKQPDKQTIQSLFEAARWAPSGSNHQPWFFIAGLKGDETYNKIFSTLVEFNQMWAGSAPLLFVTLAKITNPRGEPNPSAFYDAGQAVSMLTVQATSLGLFAHQMGGFDASQIAELFEIPADYKPVTVVAVGYKGESKSLHPKLEALELATRVRRKTSDSVFSNTFGKASDLLNND